jgi:hypothetical protein
VKKQSPLQSGLLVHARALGVLGKHPETGLVEACNLTKIVLPVTTGSKWDSVSNRAGLLEGGIYTMGFQREKECLNLK